MKQPTAGGKRRTPIWLVSAAFLMCLTSSLIAFNQEPHPNAFRPDISFPQNLVDWDWWKYPREANAFKRLPVIPSTLRDLYAAPDGLKLWAVGDNGLIVHSADGGKTWEQQNRQGKTAIEESQSLAQAARRQSSGWLNEAHAQIQQEVGKSKADGAGGNIQVNDPTSDKQLYNKPSPPTGFRLEGAISPEKQTISPQTQQATTQQTIRKKPIPKTKNGRGSINPNNTLPTPQTESQRIIEDTPSQSAPNNLERQTIAPKARESVIQQTIRERPLSKPQPPTRKISQKKESTLINPNTLDLRGISCVDDLRCWVVGERGTILATMDGGQTWLVQTSGTTSILVSVMFVSATQGWAVGRAGTILATTDGGQTWAA